MVMQRISIIADDLTGASDSGVQFARKGLRTQVVFDWMSLSQETDGLDAIVFDTDSRALPGDAAYERVKSAAEALKRKGFTWIYKKMDSTLRGNIGQEIHAVMDAYGFEAAFIAPAFPAIGRTTVAGIHYVNRVPVHETEVAKDPKTPVPESDIAKILARQTGIASAYIHLCTLREGVEATCNAIKAALDKRQKLLIFDAESDEDLQMIAKLTPAFGSRVLWAGSAGLAQFLPLDSSKAAVRRTAPAAGYVVLVAGSISHVTRAQVSEANRAPNVAAVEMNACAAIDSPETRAREIERCVSELNMAVARGLDLSLYAGSSPEQVRAVKEKGEQLGLAPPDVSNRIADTLGEISRQIVAANKVRGLVLTGGDTAKAVCKHLGVHGIELLHELEAGIPYGRLIGGVSMMAVTKAGAFGTTGSLLHAMQYLKDGQGGHKDA
jgi:uncharacterized protein YgbK (DUF1537 family)